MSFTMTQFLHVIHAESLSGFRVRIVFNNGDRGVVDLERHLTGPVFEPLRDLEAFAEVRLEGHTLSWPNGADFAPEFLHGLLQKGASGG
jgi:hypothetical protein